MTACLMTVSVWGMTPSTAQQRMMTPSMALMALVTSPPKSTWPGRVDQVDEVLLASEVVDHRRARSVDRDAPRLLLLVEVQQELLARELLGHHARARDQVVRERGLAVVDVRGCADVPDELRLLISACALRMLSSFLPIRSPMGSFRHEINMREMVSGGWFHASTISVPTTTLSRSRPSSRWRGSSTSFLAAAMISSARHSSIGFLLPWDASSAPLQTCLSARSTLRAGATSTAFGTDMPPYCSLVTSSLGAAFCSASTNSWSGFCWSSCSL